MIDAKKLIEEARRFESIEASLFPKDTERAIRRLADALEAAEQRADALAAALREHEAALIERLADEWHAQNAGTSPRAYNWLRVKARQRREEQDV